MGSSGVSRGRKTKKEDFDMYDRYRWSVGKLDPKTLKALFGKLYNRVPQQQAVGPTAFNGGEQATQTLPEWASLAHEQLQHIATTGRSWVSGD